MSWDHLWKKNEPKERYEGDAAQDAADAVLHGELDIVKKIIPKFLKPDCPTSNQTTFLHWACGLGFTDICAYLIEQGADVTQRDSEGRTVLHRACLRRHLPLVRMVLAANAEIATLADERDRTVLHYLPIMSGHAPQASPSPSPHPPVDAPVRNGTSTASARGTESLVACIAQALLQAGTPLYQLDRDQTSVLHLAATAGLVDLVEYLLACSGCLAGPLAPTLPDPVVLEPRPAFAAQQDRQSKAPIHLAAENGHMEVVQALLRCPSVTVTAQDRDGWTALHWAAAMGHDDVYRLLVEHGADPHFHAGAEEACAPKVLIPESGSTTPSSVGPTPEELAMFSGILQTPVASDDESSAEDGEEPTGVSLTLEPITLPATPRGSVSPPLSPTLGDLPGPDTPSSASSSSSSSHAAPSPPEAPQQASALAEEAMSRPPEEPPLTHSPDGSRDAAETGRPPGAPQEVVPLSPVTPRYMYPSANSTPRPLVGDASGSSGSSTPLQTPRSGGETVSSSSASGALSPTSDSQASPQSSGKDTSGEFVPYVTYADSSFDESSFESSPSTLDSAETQPFRSGAPLSPGSDTAQALRLDLARPGPLRLNLHGSQGSLPASPLSSASSGRAPQSTLRLVLDTTSSTTVPDAAGNHTHRSVEDDVRVMEQESPQTVTARHTSAPEFPTPPLPAKDAALESESEGEGEDEGEGALPVAGDSARERPAAVSAHTSGQFSFANVKAPDDPTNAGSGSSGCAAGPSSVEQALSGSGSRSARLWITPPRDRSVSLTRPPQSARATTGQRTLHSPTATGDFAIRRRSPQPVGLAPLHIRSARDAAGAGEEAPGPLGIGLPRPPSWHARSPLGSARSTHDTPFRRSPSMPMPGSPTSGRCRSPMHTPTPPKARHLSSLLPPCAHTPTGRTPPVGFIKVSLASYLPPQPGPRSLDPHFCLAGTSVTPPSSARSLGPSYSFPASVSPVPGPSLGPVLTPSPMPAPPQPISPSFVLSASAASAPGAQASDASPSTPDRQRNHSRSQPILASPHSSPSLPPVRSPRHTPGLSPPPETASPPRVLPPLPRAPKAPPLPLPTNHPAFSFARSAELRSPSPLEPLSARGSARRLRPLVKPAPKSVVGKVVIPPKPHTTRQQVTPRDAPTPEAQRKAKGSTACCVM